MTQTYTINQSLIVNILKRKAIRLIKIYAVAIILIILPGIINPSRPLNSVGISIGAVVLMMVLTMVLGFKKVRKMYFDYQVILDDNGFELKVPMAAYKRIDWREAAYLKKDNGDIKVYNKTVNTISRWWNGTGVILIPREINDKDQLLQSLDIHINTYQ
jgi:hypothetical protein